MLFYTVVRITQTNHLLARGALSATATFYFPTFIVLYSIHISFNYRTASTGFRGCHQQTSVPVYTINRVHVLLAFQCNNVAIPFLRYSEIFVENRRSEPTQPLFGALVWVNPVEFRRYFGISMIL